MAIVVLTIVTYFMYIDTKVVGDLADLSNVSMPSFVMPAHELFTFASMAIVLPTALIVALVGLIESLLTLSVLDEMGGERGSGNKKCIALGVGNTTSGLFEFSSLKRIKHMPRSDAFVLIVVTVITVFEDLAVAVIAGIIISALVFAWEHAKIFAHTSTDDEGRKIYELDGPLFFASVTSFNEQFDVENDPSDVIIDFKKARVMDSSGTEAIDGITDKYKQAGKKLSLRHLSKDCKSMLKTAGPFCTYEEDDPTYKVAAYI